MLVCYRASLLGFIAISPVGTRLDEVWTSRPLDSTSAVEEAGVPILDPFCLT